MWYVRPVKAQISLRISAVWPEPLLVAWISYDCSATDGTAFGISKLKRWLHRLVWVYTCQHATLLEITCHASWHVDRNALPESVFCSAEKHGWKFSGSFLNSGFRGWLSVESQPQSPEFGILYWFLWVTFISSKAYWLFKLEITKFLLAYCKF